MRAGVTLQTGSKNPLSAAPLPRDTEKAPAQATESQESAVAGPGHNFGAINVHSDNPFSASPIRIQPKLTVNQPGDVYEQEADAVADRVMRMPGGRPMGVRHTTNQQVGMPAPLGLVSQLQQGTGSPLPTETRHDMEQAFNTDFSRVRIHADGRAAAMSRQVQAKAFTHGRDVYFGEGQYAPGRAEGKRLLAHELTHVVQQNFLPTTQIARSLDDWLTGSRRVGDMQLSEILDEITELSQWLQRQIASSDQTVHIESALASLQQEAARREGQTRRRPARQRGRQRTEAPSPLARPLVLSELTSIVYTDPVQMRTEFDLITAWLSRDDITPNERRILTTERQTLAPQLQQDRQRVAQVRHTARLQTALTAGEQDAARSLEAVANRIQHISPDPANAELFYLYEQTERIAISRQQVEDLRRFVTTQLRSVHQRIDSNMGYYWGRYHSQAALNRDHPIIASITGWLANVQDPGAALSERYFSLRSRLERIQRHIEAGQFAEAAALIGPAERTGQEIRALARAFYEGHIEAAETTLGALEFTRDASFAIAGAIAVVVAAPVVAGYVGVGGLGLTGVTASGATVVGTGLVVGTGTAVVRGGSAFAGQWFAGATWEQMTESAWQEGLRGFREGFINGAAGGAARVLGPALGLGTSVSHQMARRIASEAIVNGTATMADTLWRTGNVGEAVRAGAISAGLSVPGAILGSSANPIVRELTAPLTAGAAAYMGARANGATPDQAMEAVRMAVVTSIVTNRATSRGGSGTAERRDAALVERGRSAGASTRARLTRPAATAEPTPAATAESPTPAVAAESPTPAPVAQPGPPELEVITGGGQTTPRRRGHLQVVPDEGPLHPSEPDVVALPVPVPVEAEQVGAVHEQLPLAAGAEPRGLVASASTGGGGQRPPTSRPTLVPQPQRTGSRTGGGPPRRGDRPRREPFADDPDFHADVQEILGERRVSEDDPIRTSPRRHQRLSEVDLNVGDSTLLGANLRGSGRHPPETGQGFEAHHIVPSNEPGSQEIVQLLRDRNIPINDADNGVWLVRGDQQGNPEAGYRHEFTFANHPEYFTILRSRLIRNPPLSASAIRMELRSIRHSLEEGRLPTRR